MCDGDFIIVIKHSAVSLANLHSIHKCAIVGIICDHSWVERFARNNRNFIMILSDSERCILAFMSKFKAAQLELYIILYKTGTHEVSLLNTKCSLLTFFIISSFINSFFITKEQVRALPKVNSACIRSKKNTRLWLLVLINSPTFRTLKNEKETAMKYVRLGTYQNTLATVSLVFSNNAYH